MARGWRTVRRCIVGLHQREAQTPRSNGNRVTVIRLHAHSPDPEASEPLAVRRVAAREIRSDDEADLALRISAGDPDALDELVRRFWEPLSSYAYRLVGDRDAAMDIAQETFLRIWENRSRKAPRSLHAYLFRITRNHALDQRKTRETRGRLLRVHDAHGPPPATPEDVLERGQIAEQVDLAIRALPGRRREVFVLAYLKGLSYAEVGEVMGISPKTVQNQVSAALDQLRELLRPLIRKRRTRGSEGEPGASDAE